MGNQTSLGEHPATSGLGFCDPGSTVREAVQEKIHAQVNEFHKPHHGKWTVLVPSCSFRNLLRMPRSDCVLGVFQVRGSEREARPARLTRSTQSGCHPPFKTEGSWVKRISFATPPSLFLGEQRLGPMSRGLRMILGLPERVEARIRVRRVLAAACLSEVPIGTLVVFTLAAQFGLTNHGSPLTGLYTQPLTSGDMS